MGTDDFGLRSYTHEEANVLIELLEGRVKRGPVVVIQNWLMKNIQAEKPLIVIQKINQMIREANGDVRVSEASEKLGLSRQYINRIMREHVGVDLKTFQKIIRITKEV